MKPGSAGLRLVASATAVAMLAGGLILIGGQLGHRDADASDDAYRAPRADIRVAISEASVGRPIPSGFVGVSFEYPAVTAYAGSVPGAVNPVLAQLIRNLAPGQRPVVRIGGDSTDTTWWPSGARRRTGGLTFGLTPRWIAVTRALSLATHARLILGVNLEANRPQLAATEARALLSGIGAANVQALEIGNEAPRYSIFPWYHIGPGEPVLARPPHYGFPSFNREFAAVAARMPRRVRLAGPTLGGPAWMGNLPRFIASEPELGLVTVHHYPFNRCFTPPASPKYPTVPRLLTTYASRGLDPALARSVGIARRRGLPLRLDETNSVACGGKRGVSDAFASALWALDSLFALTRTGLAGVNFHSFPGAAYELFRFRHLDGHWSGTVAPVYYGLLMFAQAAPPRSHLLRLTATGSGKLHAWSTRATDGTLRVLLINDDFSRRHVVLIRVPRRLASASIIRLIAPSAYARTGVTYGGQSFGATSTGVLPSPEPARPLAPGPGRYVVTVGPASAALLTLGP